MELLHRRDEDCMTRQIELTTDCGSPTKGEIIHSVLLWLLHPLLLREEKERNRTVIFRLFQASRRAVGILIYAVA